MRIKISQAKSGTDLRFVRIQRADEMTKKGWVLVDAAEYGGKTGDSVTSGVSLVLMRKLAKAATHYPAAPVKTASAKAEPVKHVAWPKKIKIDKRKK